MHDIDLLWNHLFDGLRGYLCLAYRTPTGFLHEYYTWPDEREAAARRASELGEQHDTFFGVRLFAEPRRKKDVPGLVQALWCDLDSPIDPVDWPDDVPWPTAIVESGRGWHCYWRLDAVITPSEAERLARVLVERLGADAAACDSARLLRPPGTLNHKYDPPRPVMLREVVDERQPVATFRQLVATTERRHESLREVLARTIPVGQRHSVMVRLAGLLRGDAQLEPGEILAVLEQVNRRCEQPLPSDELASIARSASKWPVNPTLVFSNGQHDFICSLQEKSCEETKIPDAWTPIPVTELSGTETTVQWVWDGFVARGCLTDFYAYWKAGKSTLLAVLLERMASGGELAGRTVRRGTALVVSEEPKALWAGRRDAFGLGEHVAVISRPFARRPSWREWDAFAAYLTQLVVERRFDVVIFDSLPNLWPVQDENSASETVAALMPLQGIASAGCGVVIVRHLRKSDGGQGTGGRGSGAISALADILVELRRFDAERSDDRRRTLSVYSRFENFEVVVRWNGGSAYETLGEPGQYAAEAQREQLLAALADGPLTTRELAEATGLHYATAAKRLQELFVAGRVDRSGSGKRGDPYYWALPPSVDFFSSQRECEREEKKPTPNTGMARDDFFSSQPIPTCEEKNLSENNAYRTPGPDDPTQPRATYGFFSSQTHAQCEEKKPSDSKPLAERVLELVEQGVPKRADSIRPRNTHIRANRIGDEFDPKDDIRWAEQLLAELQAGRVQLPPVELKPGRSVVAPERFLASHLAEAKLGISTALENLRVFRQALERAAGVV